MAGGHRAARATAGSASTTSGTSAGCTTRSTTSHKDPVAPTLAPRRAHVPLGVRALASSSCCRSPTTRSCTARARCSTRWPATRCRALREPAAPLRPTSSSSPARSCCSWATSSARSASGAHDRALDWHLLADPGHARRSPRSWRALNALYRPSRRCTATTSPTEGFSWLDADDRLHSVLCVERHDDRGAHLVVACNATTRAAVRLPRRAARRRGRGRCAARATSARFGGAGHAVPTAVTATAEPWHGRPWRAALELPTARVCDLRAGPRRQRARRQRARPLTSTVHGAPTRRGRRRRLRRLARPRARRSTAWRDGSPSRSSRSRRSRTTTGGPGRRAAASCSARSARTASGSPTRTPSGSCATCSRRTCSPRRPTRRTSSASSSSTRTWPPTSRGPHNAIADDGPVAFLCAEFGVHRSLPVYSGGLGVLAGDLLEGGVRPGAAVRGRGAAVPARLLPPAHGPVGLAAGVLDRVGPERAARRPGHDGPTARRSRSRCRSGTASSPRTCGACDVGRVPLYLLDAEIGENSPLQRWVTARLYEGNRSIRLAQYALLGVGAVRALEAMGIDAVAVPPERGPRRARDARGRLDGGRRDRGGALRRRAIERTRESFVFTTHTPGARRQRDLRRARRC